MVSMMKQTNGKMNIRDFNKAIAEYQIMNEANQDL